MKKNLKVGSREPEVKLLIHRLKDLGWLPPNYAVSDHYSQYVAEAVYGYQVAKVLDNNAEYLSPDGICGPITWACLFPEGTPFEKPIPDFAKELIKVAKKDIGIREVGKDNHGPEIKNMLNLVGLDEGAPWCCAWVVRCLYRTAHNLNIAFKFVKTRELILEVPKTAHCLTFYNWGKSNGWAVPVEDAQPGDIFIMSYGGGRGHTGIIFKEKDGWFHTIEGNTNSAGSRNGNEVAVKQRKMKDIYGMLRPQVKEE